MNKTERKRRVFMTGCTGTMGMEAVRVFADRLDRFELTLLARPSKKNKKKLAPYLKRDGISVIWGNMLNANDIRQGVENADFVLHVGGMVSPQADYRPAATFRVNTQSMQIIVDEVKKLPHRDSVGVVYIGSVAQYGPCNPPEHWGRCGDPLRLAKLDAYAYSKVAAERILSDSGLGKWVSLRQSGILSKAILFKAADPITFHVPVRGVLEWVTAEESGRLLANICETDIPDEFWNKFYNIGGGKEYRFTNYEFECRLMKALHCPPPEKVFDVRWFATDNFHGMWYEDSDRLEAIAHFRSGMPADEYFNRLASSAPWYFSLAPLAPAWLIKAGMRWVAGRNRLAPLYWKKHGDMARIDAHFGGMERWNSLPDWDGTDLSKPSDTPRTRSHGYDETKPLTELDIKDMQAAAAHRGGRCLETAMTKGDLLTPIRWQTAEGEAFTASPASVLLGGHWGAPITSSIIDDFEK